MPSAGDELITTGFKEFDNYLLSLVTGVRAATRHALRSAMKAVNAEQKQLAPSDTGQMADSIKVRAGRRKSKRIVIRSTTGTRTVTTERFYSSYQNWGFRPGKFPENAQAEFVEGEGFMQEGADNAEPRIEPIMVRELGAWIRRQKK